MSFTPYATAVAGSVLTAAFWNQQVRDNGLVLRGGGFALAGQTAGDLIYCSTPAMLGRLAAADPNTIMRGGNPPSMHRAYGTNCIWIPAGAWFPDPTTNQPTFGEFATQTWSSIRGWAMQPGQINRLFAFEVLPKQWNGPVGGWPSGGFYAFLYWASSSPSGGSVNWYFNTVNSIGDGGNLDTYSPYTQASNVDYVQNGPNYLHKIEIGPFNAPTGPVNCLTRLNLMRYTDSCPSAAIFLGLMLFWVNGALVDN